MEVKPIDVIVPVGQNIRYLARAFSSLRNSVGVDVRAIVIDNSRYQRPVVKSVLGKYDVYLHQPRIGYANALNTPLETELDFREYIGFMNADDLIRPDRFKMQISQIKNDYEISICQLQTFLGVFNAPSFYGKPNFSSWHPVFLALGFFGADATQVMSNTAYTTGGLRRTDVHHDLVDLEFAFRLFSKFRVKALNDRLYFYRRHKMQISSKRAGIVDYLSIEKESSAFFMKWGIDLTAEQFYILSPNRFEPSDSNLLFLRDTSAFLESQIFNSLLPEDVKIEFLKLLKLRIRRKCSIVNNSVFFARRKENEKH